MRTFVLTNRAKYDLQEIGRYTQKTWGRDQRNIYLRMLDLSFHQLAANPLIGNDCSEIRPGYLKINAGSHVIFYHQKTDDLIEIVRILHGRMDIETRLSKA
ncbi:MAG: type II toxin-antitoxin system RelE/ParE family toxin [Desulfobulbaceae bacterium]|nr:type II toxin-antitoxin system RelE/ParE family toxin [Desulfobulbaceae bacterium]